MLAPAFRHCAPERRKRSLKIIAFAITWLAYAMVTAGRLCFTIAKEALRPDDGSGQGFAPFNGSHGKAYLGYLDAFFMTGYTIGMPLMGMLADRLHYAYFLASGMVTCCVGFIFFGLGQHWDIHALPYYFTITFLCGVAQSTAYPCTMACMSNWFGKSNIGRTLGFWSSCSPLGNIVGKFVCTAVLASYGAKHWGPIFFVPAGILLVTAFLTALFLVPDPHQVALLRPGETRALVDAAGGDDAEQGEQGQLPTSEAARESSDDMIPLRVILSIPSLIPYCVATIFAKLVYYAFLFWLPFYLKDGIGFSDTQSGNISTLFDMGGFIGGIIGGWLSDKLGSRGLVCVTLQLLSCPMMLAYLFAGKHLDMYGNCAALFFVGVCVSTPYNLITSVAAVDLGAHPLLKGNASAKATIVGLIDGSGSLGAAVGSPLVGFLSGFGWNPVFYALVLVSFLSGSMMIAPTRRELRESRERVQMSAHLLSVRQGNISLQEDDCCVASEQR